LQAREWLQCVWVVLQGAPRPRHPPPARAPSPATPHALPARAPQATHLAQTMCALGTYTAHAPSLPPPRPPPRTSRAPRTRCTHTTCAPCACTENTLFTLCLLFVSPRPAYPPPSRASPTPFRHPSPTPFHPSPTPGHPSVPSPPAARRTFTPTLYSSTPRTHPTHTRCAYSATGPMRAYPGPQSPSLPTACILHAFCVVTTWPMLASA
jgi:hypothetical protein